MILTNGDSSAEILEKGAYVKSLSMGGQDILKLSEDGEQTHGGMAMLLPFANRVRHARYVWEGTEYSLPKNNGEHSIHGLTRNLQWKLEKERENIGKCSVKLSTPEYPAELLISITFLLEKASFTTSIEAENNGRKPAPFMAGMHPYFRFEERWSIESMQNLLRLNYESEYFPDGSMTPVNPTSLNSKCGIAFDNTYLTNSTPILNTGKGKIEVQTANMPYLVIYNGKYSGGTSVAAEPMSAAPDAFNNGIGLVSIPPGDKFHCSAKFRLF